MLVITDTARIPIHSFPLHSTVVEADLKAFNLQSDKVLSVEAIMLVMDLFSVSQSL